MKLSERYKQLSSEEREALAKSVGTDVGYLWQLATRWRNKKASLAMIQRLAAADSRLDVSDMIDEFTAPPKEAA